MIPFLSVKMAKSLFVTVEWIQENEHRFTTPAIVFHGKKDTVVDCEGSRRFVHSRPDPLKQLHLFDNGYHELQHDE